MTTAKRIIMNRYPQGIENAVSAFQGLVTGKNRGKLVVKVGAEPGE